MRSPIKDELKGEVAALTADRDHWRKRAEAAEVTQRQAVAMWRMAETDVKTLEARLKAAERVAEAASIYCSFRDHIATVPHHGQKLRAAQDADEKLDDVEKAIAAWRSTVRGEGG